MKILIAVVLTMLLQFRKIIEISQSQVESFAGNCYEVRGEDGRDKFIISRGNCSTRELKAKVQTQLG